MTIIIINTQAIPGNTWVQHVGDTKNIIIREMGNDPLILSRMNAEMFNGYDDDDDDALN